MLPESINMKKLAVFFIPFILLYACNGQDRIGAKVSKTDTTKVFNREIPTGKDGTVDLFYNLKKQKASQLKLDSLESGFDSLQIRISYDYSLVTKRDLVVIKMTNAKWEGKLYEMTVDWDAFTLTEKVISKKVKSIAPRSGWNSFVQKVLDLEVMSLPNMDDIPGLEDGWNDGVTYNVEVATQRQYRYYSYHLPKEFQDKFWQAKNMIKILELIKNELRS